MFFIKKDRRNRAFPGSIAPDFRLQDQDGNWVVLSEQTKASPVMLIFYPEDFSPVCTKQLCGYQEVHGLFQRYGLQIFGISSNSLQEHQHFKTLYKLSFSLLSDPDLTTTKGFGASSLFMLGGTSRAVFILSKGQKVLYRYVEPTIISHRKPNELLHVVEKLSKEGKL